MELLSVAEGRGRKEEITGEAKTWLISVACQKPVDLGCAAETWTTSALTKHIRLHAEEAGHARLSTISESAVFDILNKSNIKPFRIRYYCERRDPNFDSKMHNVLLVYKQLSFQFDEEGNLLPFEDEEGQVTHVFFRTVPDRFEFVFTPKHASWLNLVEGFFSKMTKQMLKGIRVKSKLELYDRIYRYFDEINETPVVYRWTRNLDDIDPTETVNITTFQNV